MNEFNSISNLEDFKNKIEKYQIFSDQYKKFISYSAFYNERFKTQPKPSLDFPEIFKDLPIKMPGSHYNSNSIMNNYNAKINFLNTLQKGDSVILINFILNIINLINNETELKPAIIDLINNFKCLLFTFNHV